MTITATIVFACTEKQSSPTSVAHQALPPKVIEPLILSKLQVQQEQTNDTWVCPSSMKSQRTVNPIRAFIDPLTSKIKYGHQRKDGKNPISLANGDPTVGGNLPPCIAARQAIVEATLTNEHAAGYANACGTPAARISIARHHSYPEHEIRPENVIVANGCSGALELALTSLLDPGSTILVPQPGFPLYQVIAESHGAFVEQYHLNPDRNWECDLDHLEEIMGRKHNVRAIVINNPSSSTGSVFSERHIIELLEFALRHRLPVVADEVYGDLTFGANKFHPMAQVAAKIGRQVPIITTSGISKQFLLPGWRVGWLTFHDNIYGSLREVQAGAKRLAQVVLGASRLTQAAVPTLLSSSTPGLAEWKHNLRTTLALQARFLCNRLSQCHGLEVIQPQGAMHAIVKINTNELDIQDDKAFATKLLEEENVVILPGAAFGIRNVFRVVCCAPMPVLEVASHRIEEFCRRYRNQSEF